MSGNMYRADQGPLGCVEIRETVHDRLGRRLVRERDKKRMNDLRVSRPGSSPLGVNECIRDGG